MAETLTVTVDDGGTYTIDVRGVDLFSDTGLTSPVSFPQSVAATTTWYAAAPGKPGARANVEVLVTASGGTTIPVQTFTSLPATVELPEGTVDFASPAPPGGSTPGGLVVRKFPFAFDTPGLATGHIVWTPADGDVLLDAWFDVETAFDGTTPLADVGTFAGANADYGFFQWTTGAIPMSTVVPIDSGLPNEFSPGINTPNVALSATTTSSVIRNVPARLQAVPLKIIVTTTGQSSGADPGATHGAATLYLVTATPA